MAKKAASKAASKAPSPAKAKAPARSPAKAKAPAKGPAKAKALAKGPAKAKAPAKAEARPRADTAAKPDVEPKVEAVPVPVPEPEVVPVSPSTPTSAPTPVPAAEVARPAAVEPRVTVRMYCQGLGDCFLLSFPAADGGQPVRVLIDCGVFLGTPDQQNTIRQVAQDIHDETNGKIDLLVVTHEHWDHISGFDWAQDIFDTFEFRQVWLSWAENDDDPDARTLRDEMGRRRVRLAAALDGVRLRIERRLRADADDEESIRLGADLASAESILDFFGPEARRPPATAGLAAAGNRRDRLGETMKRLRSLVRSGNFCSPGECRPLPRADGVKVYVLGPPRSNASIRKQNPSKGQAYELAGEDRVSLLGALEALADDERTGTPRGPFDDRHRIKPEDARLDPFFREFYGFEDDALGDSGQDWRRIDDAWLGSINALALQLDTGVNNTSLALAFELPDGRTLIFPGDAQIGNWLSWASVQFRGPDGRELATTARKLLENAVLYKVGHHGSHNATLRPDGLEAMIGGELVAMIPTDRAFAANRRPPNDGWKMPKEGLYEALKERTRHRVLLADHNHDQWKADAEAAGVTDDPHWKVFEGRVRFEGEIARPDPARPGQPGPPKPLYIEYTIPL